MWRSRARALPGGAKAFVYAVALHATLLLLLGISLRFSARTPEPPRMVRATLVDEAPVRAPEPSDTARLDAERRQAEAAEQARQSALKQQEAERQQQAEEARRRKALERKKKADALAEKKKAAALEKKRAEETHRKQAEAALKQQLAAEEQARKNEQRERQDGAAVATAIDVIRQKVQRNWSKPAGLPAGLQCLVQVRTVPGGEVAAVMILKSSGNAVFDRSVENALYKASPLPVPGESDLFERKFRVFNLDFKPEK